MFCPLKSVTRNPIGRRACTCYEPAGVGAKKLTQFPDFKSLA